MKKHPYVGIPDYQLWKKSFGSGYIRNLDPVSGVRFKIDADTRIVAAGSCFAQHVARHIKKRGYNFHVTETAHPIFSSTSYRGDDATPETFNYGMYSARYGNIYTARQLKQLVDRAYGRFSPIVAAWKRGDGRFVDPFRPQIEPDGYIDEAEVSLDLQQHLAAVRTAFETAQVIVFTLGLTEAWIDRRDGAVYPIAPGVVAGEFDPEHHEFVNFDVDSIVADMKYAIGEIRRLNPACRFLITVSPVPLNATYEPRHVLQSTVYSKSVLRVAAQALFDAFDFLDYFPSFEIITSPQCAGRYFVGDMRTVAEEGVEHVMEVFFHHYADAEGAAEPKALPADTRAIEHTREMERLVKVLCDEEAIDA